LENGTKEWTVPTAVLLRFIKEPPFSTIKEPILIYDHNGYPKISKTNTR
jgi:hypothetical protein